MKLNELHRLDEVVYIHDLGPENKKWVGGSHLLGKKLKFPDHHVCVQQFGAIGGNKWMLINGYLLPGGEDDLHKLHTHLLIAINSERIVQCVAALDNRTHESAWAIEGLAAVSGSSIPAHKMYAAFVNASHILTTDSQSEGGIKVWQKLSKEPGIIVYGWDKGKREPINLGKSFNDDVETHVSDDEMFNWEMSVKDRASEKDHMEYLRNIRSRVILVASQKGKKKAP